MKRLLLPMGALLGLAVCAASTGNAERRGVLCLSFDDYHGENWLKADAVFKEYDAHATFLIVGEITEEKAAVMKELQRRGHSVGLHTVNHRDATTFIRSRGEDWYFRTQIKPQLDACRKFGIKVRCFAYPNNRRDERTDQLLWKYFDFLRAGRGPEKKPLYYPRNALSKKMVLGGGGIGTYYKTDVEDLKKILDEAVKTDSVAVFFSHSIAPGAERIHMPTEVLEELLKHAKKLNMHVVGFEELDNLKTGGR